MKDRTYVGKHVDERANGRRAGKHLDFARARRSADKTARAVACAALSALLVASTLGMPYGQAFADGSEAAAATANEDFEAVQESFEATTDKASVPGDADASVTAYTADKADDVEDPGGAEGTVTGDGGDVPAAVAPAKDTGGSTDNGSSDGESGDATGIGDPDDEKDDGGNDAVDLAGNEAGDGGSAADPVIASAILDVQDQVQSKSEEASPQADDIITATTDEGKQVKFRITGNGTVAFGLGGSPTEGNTAIDYTYTGVLSIPSTVTSNGITYTVTSIDASALAPYYVQMTRVPCKITGLNIPSTVTSIGSQAFYYCSGITSVTIPSSVTSVGGYAFANTGLRSVVYSAGTRVSSIESGTFSGTKLQNLDFIPSTVTSIGSYAFSSSELSSAVIPSQVTTLGTGVFASCKQLVRSSFAEGSTITEIPSSTFSQCSALSSYDFNENIVSVEYSAFSGSGLRSITIPKTLTYLGEQAFSNCSSLSNVQFEEGHEIMTFSSELFNKCINLRGIELPSNLRNIGSNALAGCTRMREIVFPASIESLGEFCMQGCTSLRRISFEGNAANITAATNCFYLDNQLAEVIYYGKKHPNLTFQSSIPTFYYTIAYHYSGFGVDDAPNATFVVAANSVPESASESQIFSGELLESTPEGNAWTYEDGFSPRYEITDSFYACAAQPVEDLAVGDTFVARTVDGVDVTYTVKVLAEGTTPGIAEVGYETESGDKNAIDVNTTGAVTLPQQVVGSDGKTYTVETIRPYAFLNCSRITSLTIPSTVTSVGAKAFARCSSLKNVYFESDASSIVDDEIFAGCGKISRVIYGGKKANVSYGMSSPDVYYTVFYYETKHDKDIDHVQSKLVVHERALLGSLRDDQVYSGSIPELKVGYEWMYEAGFGEDIALVDSCWAYAAGTGFQADIEVYAGNVSTTECWFKVLSLDEDSKTGTVMVGLGKDGSTAVHTSVSGIPMIPSKVTDADGNVYDVVEVSDYAFGSQKSFQACHYLTSVNLPSSITAIGTGAFQGCELLERIEVPSAVKTMGDSTFEGCIGLSTVIFQSGSVLSAVPARAFYRDYMIEEITLPDSATSIGAEAFGGCYTQIEQKAYGLKKVGIPASCTTIGDSAFENAQLLSDIVLGRSVQTIGEKAFLQCCAARSITFLGNARNVTVGSQAFDLRVYMKKNAFSGLVFMDKKSDNVESTIKIWDGLSQELDFDTFYCVTFYSSNADFAAGNVLSQLVLKRDVSADYYTDGYYSGTYPALGSGMTWSCEPGFSTSQRTTDSYYAIMGRNINSAQVIPSQSFYYYTGSDLKPSIRVVWTDGSELMQGRDWEFDTSKGKNSDGYVNNRRGPEAYIYIVGIGDFAGSTYGTFEISTKADAEGSFQVKFLGRDSYMYNGQAHTPAVSVSATLMGDPYPVTEGVDYYVSYENNVNAGTASVVVSGTDSSIFGGSYRRTFTIEPYPLQRCKISKIEGTIDFIGGEKPEVTVVTSWGAVLVPNVDYEIDYFNVSSGGTGSIRLKGLGNYTGTYVQNFNVKDHPGYGPGYDGPGGTGTGTGTGSGEGNLSGSGSGTGTYGTESSLAPTSSATGGSSSGSRFSIYKLGTPGAIVVNVVNYWWIVLLMVAVGSMVAGAVRRTRAFGKDLNDRSCQGE